MVGTTIVFSTDGEMEKQWVSDTSSKTFRKYMVEPGFKHGFTWHHSPHFQSYATPPP